MGLIGARYQRHPTVLRVGVNGGRLIYGTEDGRIVRVTIDHHVLSINATDDVRKANG